MNNNSVKTKYDIENPKKSLNLSISKELIKEAKQTVIRIINDK